MSEYFSIYSMTTGGLLFKGSGPDGTAAIQTPPAGYGLVVLPTIEWEKEWDQVSLPAIRSALWAQVKARREALIDGGAPTSFGVMDADLVSRVNISGAATAALAAIGASQPFSIDWTNKANSVVTLDASEMIQMGLEVMSHVSACHDHARSLRAAIDAAADAATLLTIDYTAGWPS